MQVECDLCPFLSGTYDMSLSSLRDVLSDLKDQGWLRARNSCQDLCPACNAKREAK